MFEANFSNFNEIFQTINPENLQNLLEPGICHYLILGLIIFIIGIIITIVSKNLVKTLIGLQFMLNSICINFAAANTYLTAENAPVSAIAQAEATITNSFAPIQNLNFTHSMPEGQAAALIITVIGLINAVAFLGLICAVFFKFKNAETATLCALKSADCPTDKELENESGL